MHFSRSMTRNLLPVVFLLMAVVTASAQERRAMTLEDVMGFHHIDSRTINHDGSWVAYAASPDRGDGYGVLVSADGRREHEVPRGVSPRFSHGGGWALFTQVPPFEETENVRAADRPNNDAVLIRTSDRQETLFEDVRQARFSESGDFLFVHHHVVENEELSDEENEKLKEAGAPLYVEDLDRNTATTLYFVDSWTVDSMATTLVFTVKDTLEANNGLFALSLDDLSGDVQELDGDEGMKFNRLTWFNSEPRLAFTREEDSDENNGETAALFTWRPGDESPEELLSQDDAPEGYFLPFDNRLSWSNDGQRLFFGFRPEQFATVPEEEPSYVSELDSIQAQADIDIWHGEDPYIKTHERQMWNQVRRQNLMSVYHMEDQRMVQLAHAELEDVLPAPAGDYVIARTVQPYTKLRTWKGTFRDVYVMNVNTAEKQLVVEASQDVTTLSPDGSYLLYFEDKHWHSYNTRTGETINLTEGIGVPFYNETHDRPSAVPSYRMTGWMDDGVSVLLYDRYDVWLFNVANGEARNVTGGFGRDNQISLRIRKLDDDPYFSRTDGLLLEGFNDNTKVRAIYTVDGNEVRLLKDVSQNLRLRQLSGDESTILFTRESQDLFPDLWVTDTRFRHTTKLSDLQQQVEQFNWGKAELIEYQSADGVPLQGIVIKPGNYDPSKKYPVFIYYYAKYSQRLHDFNETVINHRPSFGYYASNEYVMLLPDIHFIEGRPGMSAVKSLVPATQKVIDMGIADPDAIGLHGHSWSGYQTAYVVTQTDLFAAAIAGAPVSNMTSAYSGIRWGSGLARQFQYETGQSRIGSSLFDRRYLYIENSPVFYAHEINTPLMIMHGDVDEAVPWEQSIEMYLAMRRAGKDIIFLHYHDEPHHPQKYPNKLDYTIRMREYFDHYLKGKEAPDWIREGVPFMGD